MLHTFPKHTRITSKHDIIKVLRNSRKQSLTLCSFFIMQNNLPFSRLGVIVSKKNVRHAFERNLFKRIVRDNFRQPRVNIIGKDIIVMAKKGFDKTCKKELQLCLDQQWQKLIKL